MILFSCALGIIATLSPPALLGKHPTNPGPENPVIRFHLPPPAPLTVDEALKTFKLPPGFHIECVASEPMVEDPIFCTFGADGRIWVVEMRGYMHDLEGAGEDQKVGRIRILESTNHDGKYDKATTFLDGLVMPRAVLPMRGGALVGEPPELAFWKEQDGKAVQKTVISSSYGVKGGQPEDMANGLWPALDNWIYNAAHTSRYRFQGGKWVAEFSRSRGQWGVSQDDYGRLYYCSNTDLGRVDPFPCHYFMRNPYYQATAAQNVELIPFEHQDVWPGHPTPGTNRGYTDTELRADGSLTTARRRPAATPFIEAIFSRPNSAIISSLPNPPAISSSGCSSSSSTANSPARQAYQRERISSHQPMNASAPSTLATVPTARSTSLTCIAA